MKSLNCQTVFLCPLLQVWALKSLPGVVLTGVFLAGGSVNMAGIIFLSAPGPTDCPVNVKFCCCLGKFFNLPEIFQWNTREANAPLPPIFLFFSIFKFLCLKLETPSSCNCIRCFSYPRVKDAPFFINLLDCSSNLFQRLHAVSEVLFLVLFPGGALIILFINLFLGSNEVKWHGK